MSSQSYLCKTFILLVMYFFVSYDFDIKSDVQIESIVGRQRIWVVSERNNFGWSRGPRNSKDFFLPKCLIWIWCSTASRQLHVSPYWWNCPKIAHSAWKLLYNLGYGTCHRYIEKHSYYWLLIVYHYCPDTPMHTWYVD